MNQFKARDSFLQTFDLKENAKTGLQDPVKGEQRLTAIFAKNNLVKVRAYKFFQMPELMSKIGGFFSFTWGIFGAACQFWLLRQFYSNTVASIAKKFGAYADTSSKKLRKLLKERLSPISVFHLYDRLSEAERTIDL